MVDLAAWHIPALALGYVLGSLPLGSLLIRWLSGRDAASLPAHNIGVENVLRLLGAPIAITAFLADVLKGFAALALASGNPLAALGAYAGHLYPLPLKWFSSPPRGRGNGVLLGALVGLTIFSNVNPALVLVPITVFVVILVAWRFVSVATLAGLSALLITSIAAGAGNAAIFAITGLLLLAIWRHKSSLARVIDGTEVRIGEAPPVLGSDPQVVRTAFMVHPLKVEDLWQPRSLSWLSWLYNKGIINEAGLRRMLPHFRPVLHGEFKGIALPDGRELRVMIITGSLLPDMIRDQPELATRIAVQGARFARELGAETFGLGAFWSTVGNKGQDVQDAVPDIVITNGGAYTAASVKAAVPELLEAFSAAGGSLETATAAVIGANGVVAFGVARSIAEHVGALVLIGRDEARLERSARTLARKHPGLRIETSTDIGAARVADIVVTATSDPDPVVFAEHVKPDAWIFDIGRPADVDESVRQVPGVHVIPGGVVRPPGAMNTGVVDVGFGNGMLPACMAETMIMSATKAYDRASVGPSTRSANIDFYLAEGQRLGFEIITQDEKRIVATTALASTTNQAGQRQTAKSK